MERDCTLIVESLLENSSHMWDTPSPIRSERPCKTSHGAGCGRRTETPLELFLGSANQHDPLQTRN